MHGHRLHALAAFLQPRHAVAARYPQAAAFPAGVGVVDAAVEAFGVEAGRVRHLHGDHLAVLEGDQAVIEVRGRDRRVVAQPRYVVLVDPGIVARLGGILADAVEARARILVERPAFAAVVAGRGRTVEDLALAPVEHAHMAAGERYPHPALAVDVGAARAEAWHRDVVLFRQCRLRRVGAGVEPHDRAGAGAQRAPDRAVGRAHHHGIKHLADALVLGRVHRLVGLDIVVALAVAVGVEDQRGPALRLLGIAGFVEQLCVEPADRPGAAAAGGPQRVVGVAREVEMVGGEAGIDEGVFHRLRVEHRQLAVALVQRPRLGGGVVGALFAERRVLDAAHGGGQPHPALPVDHRIVVVDAGIPNLLVAPIGRGLHRRQHGGVAGPERQRHLRIAHRRLEGGDAVLDRIENRDRVGGIFRLAEHRAVAVDGRVALIRHAEIVEIVLLVGPVPGGDDDVALEARRPLGLVVGQFALGDAVGPIAKVFVGRAAELAGRDVGHQFARLARLGAADPGVFAGLEVAERFRHRAGPGLAELMAADAAIVLDQVEIVGLLDVGRNVALAAELIGARDLHHRVPVDRRIIFRRRALVRAPVPR